MRNLKKVLSMTLALVMMLGMMTFAGAAETTKAITSADLKDMTDVENKEAVSLLVDLSVINGIKQADATYKYAPKDTINRASYAKMIYAIMMGSDNADVYKGVNTGMKDVKGHWAEGFVAYCISTKIAAGNGNGAFMPDANITVVAGAKMLLTALGYDAKASGYEGDAMWAVNIMRDAQKAGLINGVNQKSDENLTRDNAALMMFNALNIKTVVPDYQYDMGIKYLKKYDANATTLGYDTFGLIKVTATVSGVSSDKATLTNVTPSLANSYVNNKLPAGSDIVGKKVAIYVKGTLNTAVSPAVLTSVEKLISTSISTSANVTLATVMGAGIESLTNALTSSHKDFIAEVEAAPASAANAASTVTYYVNGADNFSGVRYGNGVSDAAAGGYDSTPAIIATHDVGSTVARAGVIVEFIDTDANGKANIVKITDKSVVTLTGDAATKTVDGKVQVKVPGVADSLSALNGFNAANTTKNVFGYEGLKKDDVVLGYTANGNFYFEKAAVLTGKLTATKGTTDLIIDGKTYKPSGLGGSATFTNIKAQGFNTEVNYFLDNGGYIVKAVAVEEAAKAQYAIVTGWVDKTSFGDVSAEAKLLFADGTTKAVNVVKYSATEGGTAADVVIATLTANFGAANTSCAHPVAYTIDKDGNYTLKQVAHAASISATINTTITLSAADIKNNAATFAPDTDGAGGAGVSLVGNSKTVFLVKTASGADVYEGIAKAPSYTAGLNGAAGVALVDKNGIASLVYITSGTNEGVNSTIDRAYVVDNTTTTFYPANTATKTDAYYEYEAIVAGKTTTIKVLYGSAAATKITANTVYELTLNKDGLVIDVAAVVTGGANKWFTGVGYVDGIVRAGVSGGYRYYTCNADSLIYVIDGNTVSTVNAADLSEDEIATVLVVAKAASGADANVIKDLFVIRNSVKMPTALATANASGTATVAGASLLNAPVKIHTVTIPGSIKVTPTAAAGTSVVVTITGKGTLATATNAAATYALNAADDGLSLLVTVKITDTSTLATQTLKYQIPVSFATP